MLALALGLFSSLSWGVADFCGGFASRRMAAAAVAAVTQLVGTAALAIALAAAGDPLPSGRLLAYGALAGVCGAVGLLAFYRALAVGTMSLIAPVSALGGILAVVVGLARGERPSALALLGAALAFGGAMLAARAPGEATTRGLGLAGLAALGFGGFFVFIARAADESALWAAMASRAVSVPVLVTFTLAIGASLAVKRSNWGLLAASGLLDVAANVSYAEATKHGLLSIVGVLGSLYPVATVALAHGFLGERLSRAQTAAVVVALTGIALIAAG